MAPYAQKFEDVMLAGTETDREGFFHAPWRERPDS